MIENFLDDIYLIQNISSKEFYNLKEDYKLLNPSEISEYEVHKNIKKHNNTNSNINNHIIHILTLVKNYYNSFLTPFYLKLINYQLVLISQMTELY